MFTLRRSGQSNSEPITVRAIIANSVAVQAGMVVIINTSGFADVIGTIGDKVAGVVQNIFIQTSNGTQTPPPSSVSSSGVYTAGSSNQTSVTPAYVELIIDADAQFVGDWDVTPTSNSLLTGAQTNINVTGLTLANAASAAPGTAKNVHILATDATNKKSVVKINPAKSLFYS